MKCEVLSLGSSSRVERVTRVPREHRPTRVAVVGDVMRRVG